MTNTAQHPRHEVFACPPDIVDSGLAPLAWWQRFWPKRLEIIGDVERIKYHSRNRMVADGGEVEPVRRPHAGIPKFAQRPHVRNHCIVALSDRANILVVDGDLATHAIKHWCHPDIGPSEENNRGMISAKRSDECLDATGHFVGV